MDLRFSQAGFLQACVPRAGFPQGGFPQSTWARILALALLALLAQSAFAATYDLNLSTDYNVMWAGGATSDMLGRTPGCPRRIKYNLAALYSL